MYTDGLIEGHTGVGNERLDVDGLCGLLDEPAARDGAAAGAARLAGRPGRAGQRRPARRRRGDAADLPGRWPVSLLELRTWTLRRRVARAVRRRSACSSAALGVFAAFTAAQQQPRSSTTCSTGPARCGPPARRSTPRWSTRRPASAGTRSAARTATWSRTTTGWPQEQRADRPASTGCCSPAGRPTIRAALRRGASSGRDAWRTDGRRAGHRRRAHPGPGGRPGADRRGHAPPQFDALRAADRRAAGRHPDAARPRSAAAAQRHQPAPWWRCRSPPRRSSSSPARPCCCCSTGWSAGR